MSRQRVLDVGNCDPDHYLIRTMIESAFDVDLERVMFVEQAQAALQTQRYALVLVNRLIFEDGSEGHRLIDWMKRDGHASQTPVMLISNHADAQDRAVAAGAAPGFGKARIGKRDTLAKLAEFLPSSQSAAQAPSSAG